MTFIRSTIVAIMLAMCLSTPANADRDLNPDVALKTLLERLSSEDVKIRKQAAEALQMRCATAHAGMGGMTGLSGDDDDVAEMERFRNEAKPLVATLVKLLSSNHEEIRVTAVCVLGAIGPDAEAGRPALQKIIRDGKNSPGLRLAAAPALLCVTPRHEIAGREFLEDFAGACGDVSVDMQAPDEDESPKQDDLTFAGWYGPYLAALLIVSDRTSIEVPSLVEVMQAAFPRRLRLTAIVALMNLETEARSAVPSLRKLLDDIDPQVRQFAGLAIVHIEADRAVIPSIIKAISLGEHENAEFLEEANDIIERQEKESKIIRKNGRENVLLAVPMLNHRNSFHQRQAIRMLAEIGPPANDAVPELKRLLKSEDKATRAAAEAALKKIDVAADFSIRLHMPYGIFITAVLLDVVSGGLHIGVAVCEQHLAIRKFEQLGGHVRTSSAGPNWLRSCVGDDGMRQFGDVAHVFLAETAVTDADMAGLRRMAGLKGLDLNMTAVTDKGVANLAGLTKLEWLRLEETGLTDAGVVHLAGLTSLKKLSLDGTAITDAGFANLKHLTKLKVLDINNTMVTDAGLVHLEKMTELRLLYLNGTKVTDAGLLHLKVLPNIRGISIDGNGVTDAGLGELSSLTSLDALWLCRTALSDSGLAHLKGLTKLKWLNLNNTKISDAGLVHLEALPSLEMLYLQDTAVSEGGVARLKKALPGLRTVLWSNVNTRE